MDWSFQLYSARNFQPWDKVLKMLGGLGYREVEGYGGVYDDPVALRREIDRNGLRMPTGHFSIDLLETDFDGARKIADTLGIRTMVCPYLHPDARPEATVVGWRGFGERLAAVGDRAKRDGYGFAWHNHDFEFHPLADGSVPQEHIFAAAPDISWEMDVAWIIRGGADPQAWIERHGHRVVCVHVKDIAKPGEGRDEDGWADVGHGTVDWPGLMKLMRDRTPARHFIMEHDNPGDIERFARRSLESVNTY